MFCVVCCIVFARCVFLFIAYLLLISGVGAWVTCDYCGCLMWFDAGVCVCV